MTALYLQTDSFSRQEFKSRVIQEESFQFNAQILQT